MPEYALKHILNRLNRSKVLYHCMTLWHLEIQCSHFSYKARTAIWIKLIDSGCTGQRLCNWRFELSWVYQSKRCPHKRSKEILNRQISIWVIEIWNISSWRRITKLWKLLYMKQNLQTPRGMISGSHCSILKGHLLNFNSLRSFLSKLRKYKTRNF
jgi:hypothetical protein